MRERIQQSFRETLTSASMREFLGVNSLYPRGQVYFNEVVLPSMLAGEKRQPSWDCEHLFAGYEINVVGEENIRRSDEPAVFIVNHWSKGPLRAWWYYYLASERAFANGGQDIRWVIQDALEMRFGRFNTGREVPLLSQSQRKFSETYNLIQVRAAFKKGKDVSVRKVVREFANGETLGLAPELAASTDLKRGSERAGQLVNFLAKIRPLGSVQPVYAASCGNELLLKFGEARRIRDFRCVDSQVVADRLMGEIQKLVPNG